MISLKSLSHVTARPEVYCLWQAPFVEAKLRPLRKHNDLARSGRVLDVGCGPGTNAPLFRDADYCGLDINADYVAYARRRYGREFLAQDVCEWVPPAGKRFDFILLNSLLHHLDHPSVERLLERLRDVLAPAGHIHILDLVLPERPCVARWLAQSDRGDYPRPLDEWRLIFENVFQPVLFEPYAVSAMGVTLWSMVYFKGRARP